jgi:hypothetical protein
MGPVPYKGFKQTFSCDTVTDVEGKKTKPTREGCFFQSKLIFQNNDFRYIDKIADPNRRKKRDGAKGYPRAPYIHGSSFDVPEEHGKHHRTDQVPEYKSKIAHAPQPQKKNDGKLCFKVPHRDIFNKFA